MAGLNKIDKETLLNYVEIQTNLQLPSNQPLVNETSAVDDQEPVASTLIRVTDVNNENDESHSALVETSTEGVDPNSVPEEGLGEKIMEASKKGEWAVVEQILRHNNKDAVSLDGILDETSRQTPLMLACRDNKLVLVERMLDYYANVNEQDKVGMTALHYAAGGAGHEVVKLLLTKKADTSIGEQTVHMLPIHIACSRASPSPAMVTLLCSHTKNARMCVDDMGKHPLMHAVEQTHYELVRCLLEKESQTQLAWHKKDDGDTALHVACKNQALELIRILCDCQAPLEEQNHTGATPLHISAQLGDEAALRYFYSIKANANVVDFMDRTPLHLAAERGHSRVVEYLIDKFQSNVLHRDKDGNTLMHLTSMNGFPETTGIFLRRGVPLQMPNKSGSLCLHAATRAGHVNVIQSLLEKGANVDAKTKNHLTALHEAVMMGRTDVVETLLGYGASVAVKGGETPLHLAAELQRCHAHRAFEETDLMKLLVLYDPDMNAPTKLTLETPMHYCARAGNTDLLQEIVNHLKHKINMVINKTSKVGWSALFIACERGHLDMVQILLKTNARVDVFDEYGMSALHVAAENGHKEVVRLLLLNKAFINAKSKAGLTPLHLAADKGFKDLVLLLMEHSAQVDCFSMSQSTPLHMAAAKGHQSVCEVLLSHRVSPADAHVVDSLGKTPLHLAAENDHPHVVKLFLKLKPELIGRSNSLGMSCVHIAASRGSLAVVKELMRFNKTLVINSLTKGSGSSLLHLASEGGHEKLVKYLLDSGSSPLAENKDGMTALQLAAKGGHTGAMNVLLTACSALSVSTRTGLTALHVAAQFGQVEAMVELSKRVPVNIRSQPVKATANNDPTVIEFGFTPMHLAAQHGHEEVMRMLLNNDSVDVMIKTSVQGVICLHLAAERGHLDVASLLLGKNSTQISVRDTRGRSALHFAAGSGHIEMVQLLLGQGADVNARDLNNHTPLHLASKNGFTAVVRVLVESGADTLADTNELQTALTFAAGQTHTDVIEYLLHQPHNTTALTESFGFLFDLMLCGELNDRKSIDDFILLSPAPIETAAKLSQQYLFLAEKEKMRAHDLQEVSQHCESLCTDLLALALYESTPEVLLTSVDSTGTQLLDILIGTEQKQVIAHGAVQAYLSDVWCGDIQWSTWHFLLVFFLLLVTPGWLVISLPWTRWKWQDSPVIKFMVYFISHIYLFVWYFLVSVWMPINIYDRTNLTPNVFEWLLLLWVSGLLVAELTNPVEHSGLGALRLVILGVTALAVLIHIYAMIQLTVIDWCELLYIRNLLFSLCAFMTCIVTLDFLTFHYLFGPWVIIIRELLGDLGRFLVVFSVFIVAFSCVFTSIYLPTSSPTVEFETKNTFEFMVLLYFALYNLVQPTDFPRPQFAPDYSSTLRTVLFSLWMCLSVIVLVNLLITMMTDTYYDIHAQSDIEWKFGRAKLIRNMNKTFPTPPPLIMVFKLLHYIQEIHRFRQGLRQVDYNPLEARRKSNVDHSFYPCKLYASHFQHFPFAHHMALNLFRGFGLGIWHSTGSLFKLPTLQKNILLLEEKERRRSVASSRHSKPSSDPAAVSNSATGGFAQSRSRVARHQQLQQQQQQQQQQQLSENASETAAAASTSSTLSPGGASSSSQSQQHFYQKGIFAPIFMIWAENLKLLLIPMLLLDFFLPYLVRMLLNAFLPSEDVAFVCEVGSFALYLFWKVPILVIMEVINLGHLKKISRLLGSVRKPVEAATSTRTAPSSGVLANEEVVHGLFVNRLYVPLFLLVFNLQGVVLSNVAQFLFGFYSKQIVTIVHASLLYSFYVFDYYWLDMGRPFQERYYRMRVAWPYFLGFGLPMGLFQVTWPSTISLSALGLNIVYPLLLISAYLVHWSAIKDSVTLQGSYLKLSLADIYRPSFWISNKLMHIFQRVLNRYSMIPAK